jgi:geranylgeranyl diphosphate synthase type II
MDLDAYLKEYRAHVDKALDGYLPGEDVLPANLHKAMR